MRPAIGITPDAGETTARPGRPAIPRYELKRVYADAVLAAGGLPLVLPYSDDPAAAREAVEVCDGLVITGGAFDIPPEIYGAKPGEKLGRTMPARTTWEQRLLGAALEAGIPVLGICGGMQLIAVELGGTLHQDIGSEIPHALEHEQREDPRLPSHPVDVVPGSALAAIVGAARIDVNSTHHQAVKDPGKTRICAVAPDGVVEAIEVPGKFVLGVEWHPELLAGKEHLALYRALVERARG